MIGQTELHLLHPFKVIKTRFKWLSYGPSSSPTKDPSATLPLQKTCRAGTQQLNKVLSLSDEWFKTAPLRGKRILIYTKIRSISNTLWPCNFVRRESSSVLLRQLTALSNSKRLTETAFTSLQLTTCLLFPNLIFYLSRPDTRVNIFTFTLLFVWYWQPRQRSCYKTPTVLYLDVNNGKRQLVERFIDQLYGSGCQCQLCRLRQQTAHAPAHVLCTRTATKKALRICQDLSLSDLASVSGTTITIPAERLCVAESCLW